MIIIDEILISDAVIDEHFLCNLKACKGACCWEGDFGAPLEKEEMDWKSEEIDVSSAARGMLLIQMQNEKGDKVRTEKVILH